MPWCECAAIAYLLRVAAADKMTACVRAPLGYYTRNQIPAFRV